MQVHLDLKALQDVGDTMKRAGRFSSEITCGQVSFGHDIRTLSLFSIESSVCAKILLTMTYRRVQLLRRVEIRRNV